MQEGFPVEEAFQVEVVFPAVEAGVEAEVVSLAVVLVVVGNC